jgi:hypothetical protein
MRYQTLNEVTRRADIQRETPVKEMSRAERLDRWVQILTARGGELLSTLEGTEYKSADERALMRQDNSPLTVAFQDPVLRDAGLAGDTYGDAKRFFGLSDHDLHYVVCHCHCGSRMSGHAAADRVRALIPGGSWLRNMVGALRRWLH